MDYKDQLREMKPLLLTGTFGKNRFMKKFIIIIYIIFSPSTNFGQQPKLVLPIGHSEMIYDANFSHSNKKIITCSLDGTAKIWDAQSGALLLDINDNIAAIQKAFFSPDDTRFVTFSQGNSIKLWNGKDGNLIANLQSNSGALCVSTFSNLGDMIAAGFYDGTAKIWDTKNGRLITNIRGDGYSIQSICISPDRMNLITVTWAGYAEIWNVQNGKLEKIIKVHKNIVSSVCFSPNGKYFLTASWDSTAAIWETSTGYLLANLKTHLAKLNGAVFSPDGNKVLTYSADFTAKVWNAYNGELLNTLDKHSGEIYSASFSPDGTKILTASADRTALIWETNSGRLLQKLKGHSDRVYYSAFSNDGKKIATASADNIANIWDAAEGILLVSLKGHDKHITKLDFSADQKRIITTYRDSTAKVWDAGEWTPAVNLKSEFNGWINTACFSPDGKTIVAACDNNVAIIWNAINGKFINSLKGHTKYVLSAFYSSNGKKIVTASWDSTAKIWDSKKNKLLTNLVGHKDHILMAVFSPDNNKVVTASMDKLAKVWDVKTGKFLFDLKGHSKTVCSAFFSHDNKFIVTASWDSTAKIWDATNGKLLLNLTGHSGEVNSAFFSSDDRSIITGSIDYTTKIWDSRKGEMLYSIKSQNGFVSSAYFASGDKKIITASNDVEVWGTKNKNLLYTFFMLDDHNSFRQIPSGYYQCTSEVAKLLHYVTKDLKVISFEQLDVKYNRPDKVLEAIGNTGIGLIKSYQKAYEKRIKKLGIDTTTFRDGYSVPEADFANRESIEREQKQKDLMLHIVGADTAYKLDRYNIWVNEVPVYGQRGISIRSGNSNNLDITTTIHLSEGENKIETSITNVNGTESYRMPLIVDYNPLTSQKPIIHFIGIGIDKFAESKYNLQYSTKDIRDLSFKLKEKFGNEIIIDTLFNADVSIDKVKALKNQLLQTTENDKVIIAYSGHGVLSKDFDYYLSTYSMNFEMPEKVGLSYEDLENLVDSIPARKKLMLIDACHSGELDKEDLVALNNVPNSVKGIKPVLYKQNVKHLGLKNSFELMQSLFVNVGKGTGAVIISAAAGTQFALESGDLKNGVFTFSILEALNKYPTLRISELKKIVSERVEQITHGLQKPTSRKETIAVDWDVW